MVTELIRTDNSEEEMAFSAETILRMEYLARFYQIQMAIDCTTDKETLAKLEAQKKELSEWLTRHS